MRELNVFILGLDGLEYDLVEKWNLTNLKQKEYDRIEVPINKEKNQPSSPEVWASFLTGRVLSNLKFEMPFHMRWTLKVLRFLRRYINLSLGLGKRVKGWGLITFPKKLEMKTFLDITNSKPINVPYINYDNSVQKIIRRFIKENLSVDQTLRLLEELYEERKQKFMREMRDVQEFDVAFFFMHQPDVFQHFLAERPREIKRYYLDLDSYVATIKKLNKFESTFIIVSDHGYDFKTLKHSHYGFYSSNKKLSPKPKRITDFHGLILEKCGKVQSNERERVIQRLRNLGYI